MSGVVIDTGPTLNFLASGHHGILFEVLQIRERRLLMPQTVEDEVASKGERDTRFATCAKTLSELCESELVEVLTDDISSIKLDRAVQLVSGDPLSIRVKDSRDLGETLVLAHALVLKDEGADPTVLIDERPGQDRARQLGLRLISSVGILKAAAGHGLVTRMRDMKRIYQAIERCDTAMGGWTSPMNPLNDKTLYGRRVTDSRS